MVRAILDGRKTITRRLVKPQPDEKHQMPLGYITSELPPCGDLGKFAFGIDEFGGHLHCVKPPYQPGDILYVRETWQPSIHMPKEAARIWLKVKDVRVERLQECGKSWCLDIKKEGVVTPQDPILYSSDDAYHKALREEFQKLWNSTIKKSDIDRYGWDTNPWVWVIEFERIEVE